MKTKLETLVCMLSIVVIRKNERKKIGNSQN